MNKVIGMDLGDKQHLAVVFDETGNEMDVKKIGNTSKQVQKFFGRHPEANVIMEAGTHSAWISRLLTSMGHNVLVGNPRKLRVIWDADDKSDERDARILGLMYRLEPRLLHPIFHRSEQSQADLAVIKARCQLVETRSKLIVHIRSVVKGVGERIPSGSAEVFARRAVEHMPETLREALMPLVEVIKHLNDQIAELDHRIERMCRDRYPETEKLRAIAGVGPITALAYVLTLESPDRFEKSRDVGAFLGLVPRRDQSGQTDKQLPITKAGNMYLRKLLVNCAHYILGAFGPDSDLRRYGLHLAERGGKNAKKRAVVAVARKLAVLMHRVWADNNEYIALYKQMKKAA